MGLTNFPNGVSSFGVPLLGSGPIFTTGAVRFVHAGTGSASYTGLDPDRPLLTIDAAINASTASSSTYAGEDYIVVLPGHVETAAAITFDLDVDGVNVVGLGSDGNRPTITYDTTTDLVNVSGSGVGIANLLFVNAIDALASFIIVDGGTGAQYEALEFEDGGSSINDLDSVSITANARQRFVNCYWADRGAQTGGQSALLGTTADQLIVDGCRIVKDSATALIELTNATDLRIVNNYAQNLNAADKFLEITATATGWVDNNFIRLTDDAANITECISDASDVVTNAAYNVQLGRNWVSNRDAERVIEHNMTQSTDSA